MTPAETPTECEQYYERAPGYGNLLPSKKHDADLHALIRALEEERDGLRAALTMLVDAFPSVLQSDDTEVTEKVRAALDGEGKP